MSKKKNDSNTSEVTDYFKRELGSSNGEKVEHFISTGSTLLDYAIANRKDGGVPMGRIIEISGHEASGKSLIAYHIMANTQKKGGVVFYIDTERAYNEEFMARMGVNLQKQFILAAPTPTNIEEVFDYIEKVVTLTRMKFPNKDVPITIVWDSVAATMSKEEAENAHQDTARLGPEARAMSRSLRKVIAALDQGYVTLVCINQLRQKIGVMFGDPDVTSHGKALPFYSSVRVKLKSHKQIKDTKNSRIVGVATSAKVFKNKVAPPYRSADFQLLFDWGVDDTGSWMGFMKDYEYINTRGAWSTIEVDGVEHKFQSLTGWKELLEKEPSVGKFCLEKMEEHLVYKFDRKPDSIEIDTDSILEVTQVQDDMTEVSSK